MAESAQKSKENAKSKVDSMTGKRENLGTKLPSECSIQGKELGSLLSHHRIKKYPDLASTRLRIHSVFKNVHSGERTQKYPDKCGQGLKLSD